MAQATGEPFESAVRLEASLRAYGLGDPKGGAYRRVSNAVPNDRGWASRSDLRGWSFPDGRFVTRDGLTYLGINRTEPADLDADVAKEIATLPHQNGLPPQSDEIQGRLHAAVLVAATRRDLAGRLLSATPPYDEATSNLATISAFVTRRYEQAVAVHLAGDDREARRVEQGLAVAAEAYERKNDPSGREPWWEVSAIRKLTLDTERRLAASYNVPQQDSAQRLVTELQDARVTQNSLPGRAQFVDSATVRHLIALGDQAVDPLLDCVEFDRRLTRSASFGQSFIPTVETVETAARTALFALLDVPVFDASVESGVVPVWRLRAWWYAHRDESRPRRQLDVLADDAQSPTAWGVAADRLFGDPRLPHLFDAPEPIGRGLRPPAPGVRTIRLADLLVRRARQFDVDRPGYTRGYEVHKAAQLAAMLTLLDRPRGLTLIGELTREAGTMVLAHPAEYQAAEVVGSGFAFRADQGDSTAWTDYRDWLRRQRVHPLRGIFVDQRFKPLIERPREPALRGAATELFGVGSPWRPLALAKMGLRPEEFVVSKLLDVPEVRQGVIELLRDPMEGATLTVEAEYAQLRRDGEIGTEGFPKHFDAPALGTLIRLRYADLLAYRLQGLRNMPDFHLDWSVEKRDAALAEMIRVIGRGGELYRFRRWRP